MSEGSHQFNQQQIKDKMLTALLEAENEIDDISGLIIIKVNSKGNVHPEVFFVDGGRLLLLAGLDLAKADLLDIIKENPGGCTCDS